MPERHHLQPGGSSSALHVVQVAAFDFQNVAGGGVDFKLDPLALGAKQVNLIDQAAILTTNVDPGDLANPVPVQDIKNFGQRLDSALLDTVVELTPVHIVIGQGPARHGGKATEQQQNT